MRLVNEAVATYDAHHDALDDLNGAELREFYAILERRSQLLNEAKEGCPNCHKPVQDCTCQINKTKGTQTP